MAHAEGRVVVHRSHGEGNYTFTLLTFAEALRLYQVDLPDVTQLVPFEEAFPGYDVEEG